MRKDIILSDKTINNYIRYLQEQERSVSTIKSYQRELMSLQLFLDDSPLTKDKLLSYKSMITAQYSPSTCNVTISALNSFLRYIGRPDLMIKPLKIQKQIYETADKELTRKEYDKLIRAANINGQERLSLIMQTICSTGIRVSELQYITVEAIKEGKTIATNKGKSRIVFIPNTLQKLLKKYVINSNISSGPIFITRSGKPLDRSNIWAEMKRLCTIAKVNPEKVYPHNLRHLFARCYYTQYKDLSRLSDILGHTNVSTTKIYTKESGAVHARQIAALGLVRDTT